MATRFYLHNDAAPYTPATIQGAWDSYASAVTKRIDASRVPVTATTSVAVAETSTTDEWDILLYRGVSGPLAAATIGTGTVDVVLPVVESNTAANLHYHLHIYVTQGDSDTPRGDLLTDYREDAGVNEWGTLAATCGRALNAAAVLSSLAVSAGDRLVIEIGYTARNTSATSYTGALYYGAPAVKADLAVGGPSTNIGYVEFSEAILGTADLYVSQGPVETLLAETTVTGCVSQGPVEVLVLADNEPFRVSQEVAEVLHVVTGAVRVSQTVVELAILKPIGSLVTQVLVEVLLASTVAARASQIVVELLGKSPTYSGTPSVPSALLCGATDVLAWLEWTVPMKEN